MKKISILSVFLFIFTSFLATAQRYTQPVKPPKLESLPTYSKAPVSYIFELPENCKDNIIFRNITNYSNYTVSLYAFTNNSTWDYVCGSNLKKTNERDSLRINRKFDNVRYCAITTSLNDFAMFYNIYSANDDLIIEIISTNIAPKPSTNNDSIQSDDIKKLNFQNLFSQSHEKIIESFGIPKKIYISSKSSNIYQYRNGKNIFSITDDFLRGRDIIFLYEDQGITFTFDNGTVLENLYSDYKSQMTEETTKLHLCEMSFTKPQDNLPYGLTFSDNFVSILEKLGNPDSYSKTQIDYKIEVKNVDVLTREIPFLVDETKATDYLTIFMEDSKIIKINIQREYIFTVCYP